MTKPLSFCVFLLGTFLVTNLLVGDVVERVENHSFEQPVVNSIETFSAPGSEISGWTLVSGTVDIASERLWDARLDNQSMDLVGNSLGTIEQTVAMEIGGEFDFRLWFANNPDVEGEVSAEIQLISNSTVFFEKEITHSGSAAGKMSYNILFYTFFADSEELHIRIRAIDQFQNGGIVIDGVSVTEFILGDMNCDGTVSLLDVGLFVQCITNCVFNRYADINRDGFVNLLDVEPFVDLLNSQK